MFAKPVSSSVHQIFTRNLDGTGETALTGSDADRDRPSTRQGLSKLVYVSTQTGNEEIFISNFDGSMETNLTNHAAADFDPVMSADGSTIAFISNRNGQFGLYAMDANGANLRLLSTSPGVMQPSLSANGSRVVFTAAPFGFFQIFRMETNGTGLTNLSNDLSFDDLSPTISPDGTRVAFTRDDVLTTMDINGLTKTTVLNLGDLIESPSYTSDGTQIVFNGLVGFAWDIFRVNVNGTGLTNLTNTASIDEMKTSGYIGL